MHSRSPSPPNPNVLHSSTLHHTGGAVFPKPITSRDDEAFASFIKLGPLPVTSEKSTIKDLEAYLSAVQQRCREERRESSLELHSFDTKVAVHAAQGDHSLLGGDPSRLVQQLQDQVTRLTQQLKSRDIHIESLAQHNASLTDSISRMQRDAAAMWQNKTAPCLLPDSTEPLRVKLLVEDLKSASTQIETLTQQLVTLQRRSTILGVSVLQLKWRYSISQAVANESKQHIKRLQFINYEAVEHIQKYRNRIAVLESDILAFKEQFHLQRQLPTRNSPQNCDIATQTDNDLRTPTTAPVLIAPITTRSLPLSPRDAETAFELFETARWGTIPISRLPQVLTVLGLIPGEPFEGRDTVLANIDAKFSAYVDRTEFLSIVAFCQRPSEKPMVATRNGHRSSI